MLSEFVNLAKRGFKNPSGIPPYLNRKVRQQLQKCWPMLQFLGVHIVPNHFYYPIPDTERLKQKEPWGNRFPTEGIRLNVDMQLQFLEESREFFSEYESSVDEFSFSIDYGFPSGADGPILYAMVRKHQPNKIIEIGSGQSTEISLRASEENVKNGGDPTDVIAIEPFPDERLLELDKLYDNLTIVENKAEKIPAEKYLQLTDNDFLFIDSSHTVTMGNDVAHLYLRVLPKLPKGVLIHIHDIHFPHDLPKEWVIESHRFWTEQYLLQTFLMFNISFEVIWSGHYLGQDYRDRLKESIATYRFDIDDTRGDTGTRSFWIKRVE